MAVRPLVYLPPANQRSAALPIGLSGLGNLPPPSSFNLLFLTSNLQWMNIAERKYYNLLDFYIKFWNKLPLDVQAEAIKYDGPGRKQITSAPAGFTAVTKYNLFVNGGYWNKAMTIPPDELRISYDIAAPNGTLASTVPTTSYQDLPNLLKSLAFEDSKSGWGILHDAFRSAVKFAFKIPVYVATAPLQLTSATKPIASKIQTTILNNPLTAASILAAATAATLATAPAAASTAAPAATAAPAVTTAAPAVTSAVTTAAPAATAATITGAGASVAAPSLLQAAAGAAPALLSTAGTVVPALIGARGGGPAPQVPSAEDNITAPAPNAAPSWTIPALIGGAALLLAYLNA